MNGTLAAGGSSPAPMLLKPSRLYRSSTIFLLSAMGGYLLLTLTYAPLLWLGVLSFSTEPLSGSPNGLTFEWYGRLLSDLRWVDPVVSSVGVALIVGLACAASAIIVARVLPAMRLRAYYLVAFLVPLFIPGVLLGVGLFLYFRVFLELRLGWWSICVSHFIWAYPFSLLALLVATTRFDTRLTEAAADLGAGPWRRFRDIEFPIILPGVVAAALFGFLLSFNELSRSIMLRGTRTTLPIFEWAAASSHTSNVPLIFALSTIVLVVSLVIVSLSFWCLFGRKV